MTTTRGDILVFEADAKSALPVAESLSSRGFRVVAASSRRWCAAFYSRAVRERILMPSEVAEPRACQEFLLNLVRRRRFEMIIPLGDIVTELVCRKRDEFLRCSKLVLVPYEVFSVARDKVETMKAAVACGVPIPKTFYPEEQPLDEIAELVEYPVLVKPAVASGARGIYRCNAPNELRQRYADVHRRFGRTFVQELVPHTGLQYKADLVLDYDGRLLSGVVYSKIRYYPPTGGSSVLNESVENPLILSYALTIARSIGWFGLIDFDFIHDVRDDTPKLMEINPRFPESFRMNQVAGVDPTWMLYRMASGEKPEPVHGYRTGVYLRFLPGDLMWFLTAKGQRFRSRPSFFRFFDSRTRDQIISARDPGPAIGYLMENLMILLDPRERQSRFRLEAARAGTEATGGGSRPLNILSVDVEDYHDQLALDFQNRIVPPDEEAVRATDILLELFAELNVRGTFFILGEIAEHFPDLVRRIADRGHHLGIHGYHHHLVYRMTREQFRSAAERAKKRVEDVAGRAADAYRATAFSFNASTPWAIDTLIELGFKYDSSVYPFKGRRYGDPSAPRHPYLRHGSSGGSIWEVPMSTVVKWGRRWPVCGGGYLRHFPLSVTDRAIRSLNAEGLPAVMYLHPYEVIPDPVIRPLPDMSFRQRLQFAFFNYHQLRRRRHTVPALRHLLAKYRFGTLEEVVAAIRPGSLQSAESASGTR